MPPKAAAGVGITERSGVGVAAPTAQTGATLGVPAYPPIWDMLRLGRMNVTVPTP